MTTLVAERPPAGPSPDWSFPGVTRTVLDGVTVVAAHLPARRVVQASVVFAAGATADPTGRRGLASLLGDAVLRGAGGRDQHDLAVAFERVGAVPGTSVSMDSASIEVEAPAGLLAEALGLVADVLRRPTLDPDEVANVRDARVDAIRGRTSDTGFRAERATPAALFAPESRYAEPVSGTEEVLRTIDPAEVAAAHAQAWADAPVTLVLAGDLAGLDLDEVARPLAGGAGTTTPPATSTTPAATGRRAVLVPVGGAVQSALRLVVPGPAYGSHPDEAALAVAQAAVHGTFGSRLNLRLREELGYTYGASGGLVRLRDGGWLRVGCSVRTEVTADAVSEAVGVLRTAVDDGLTDAEVAQARDNLVRKFPVRYDSAGAVAQALVNRVVHDLDDDERDRRLAELREVDTAAASAALGAAIDVDDLVTIVAGDADAVRDDLAATDVGDVVDA